MAKKNIEKNNEDNTFEDNTSIESQEPIIQEENNEVVEVAIENIVAEQVTEDNLPKEIIYVVDKDITILHSGKEYNKGDKIPLTTDEAKGKLSKYIREVEIKWVL